MRFSDVAFDFISLASCPYCITLRRRDSRVGLFDDIFSNAIRQHEEILDALKSGSLENVLALERSHISKIDTEASGYQKAYPQYFK